MRRRAYVVAVAGVLGGVAFWWRRRTPTQAAAEDGILGPGQVRHLYDQFASNYDLMASVYDLVGSRRLAAHGVRLLNLGPGDVVVDLGCGTGVNLPQLAAEVGPEGRVIGVDLSAGMLDQARQRVASKGLTNVELVQQDVREFEFPADLHGVVATFALEMVPEHDEVIARACRSLSRTGGGIAVMGLREPPGWPRWAIEAGIALGRPFGVSEAYTHIHPWEAVQRHTDEVAFETRFFGSVYLAVGRAR